MIEQLRDLVNESKRKYGLFKNKTAWSQLCASMDVIDDAQFAIDAYPTAMQGDTCGSSYLAIYGLMQALVLQQDAVFHLCQALGVGKKLIDYPMLMEIREIRIKTVGHPTKRDRPKPVTYHHICQSTMSSAGFQLMSHDETGDTSFRFVSIPECITNQRKAVSEVVSFVIEELGRENFAHKEKFKMEKLAAIFPPTLGYDFEKLYEGTRSHGLHPLGLIHLRHIESVYKQLLDVLKKRGIEIDTYDWLKYLYDQIGYPIEELEAFLGGDSVQGGRLNNKDAYIFAYFIEAKLKELRQFAEELDGEYSS